MMAAAANRVAWVTGAGKGIGRALVKRLVTDGWTVAASARTHEDLASLVAECPPGTVHGVPLDVTDAPATEVVVKSIETQLGDLDMVILNAGTHRPMAAEDFAADTFRTLMDTNLMGTVNGLAEVLPRFMSRRRGHVAVVASLAGYLGLPTAAAYGASKAALINMCEALRPELAHAGVKLQLINPGFVETPLTDKNDFPMPFLIPAETAAERIATGLKSTAFEIAFPWRFSVLMKILRLLPYHLFFAATRRMIGR